MRNLYVYLVQDEEGNYVSCSGRTQLRWRCGSSICEAKKTAEVKGRASWVIGVTEPEESDLCECSPVQSLDL